MVLVFEHINDTTGNASIYLRFNGDTGANYNSVYALGYGSGLASGTRTSVQYINLSDQIAINNGEKNLTVANILDYTATDKHKSVVSRSNSPESGVNMVAGRWANTSAVTQIDLVQSSGTNGLSAGSTFAIYGIEA